MSKTYPIRPLTLTLLLVIGLVMALITASTSGALRISWAQWLNVLWPTHSASTDLITQVFWQIRLPRVLFSALVGAALAVAGAVMQALFRNPLAEPGLIGISSGASMGAVMAIVLTSSGFLGIATAAFVGSLIAMVLAYVIGRSFTEVAGLLLAGIAINTITGSVIGLFTYSANDNQLRDLTFWSMGSLAGGSWYIVGWLVLPVLGLRVYLCKQWRLFNALLLGEREAWHLGYDLQRWRWVLLVAIALLVGPLVAVTGGIGFVGLVVPHFIRLLVGSQHQDVLPLSVLVGAILLTLADALARVIVSPAELPIGLVTSLLGGPFFLWLIVRSQGGKHD